MDAGGSPLWTFQWPLWGLRAPDGDVPIDAGLFSRPSWRRWEHIEKTDVVRAYAGQWVAAEGLGQDPVAKPPVCFLRTSAPDPDGWPGPLAMHRVAAYAVFDALLLLREGDFAHPSQTGDYMELGEFNLLRSVRPWRAAFYDRSFPNPYELRAGDTAELDRLAGLISGHGAHADNVNGELALEHFRLGHLVGPPLHERAMLLFGALEALLGPLRDRFAGTSRAELAARAARRPELQEWLAGDAIRWRNQVAHGERTDTTTGDSAEDLRTLREVTRAVIVAFLECADRLDPTEPNLVHAFLRDLSENR